MSKINKVNFDGAYLRSSSGHFFYKKVQSTNMPYTCVRAFVYHCVNQGQIWAQYTPRTPLFEFWINEVGSGKKLPKLLQRCYKVSWGGKMTATQSSTVALSVKRLKEYSFTLFHHVFWKRTIFGGVPLLELLELWVPKVIVSAFCDQVIAKQAVESCTGKRNLEISLGIVWEKCTERFFIVGSEGFHAMH